MGSGNRRPKLTWTLAAGTFLFDVANVQLSNFILDMAPAANAGVTVAAPITVSAAGCSINNCRIMFGADVNDLVTIGVTTTAAADDFDFSNNRCYGATAAACTTFLRLVGADRFTMYNTVILGGTSSTTVGVVQMLTTASTDVDIENCSFANRKAASVHACTGMAAATGSVRNCSFGILDDSTLAGWETEGNLQFFNCQTVNLAGEAGVPKTPLSTT
jgi:hypothetical protein